MGIKLARQIGSILPDRGRAGVIPERRLPIIKVTSCKSIQSVSLAKSSEYSHLAAAKSVAGLGTPNIWN
jgi:hypothetical protein